MNNWDEEVGVHYTSYVQLIPSYLFRLVYYCLKFDSEKDPSCRKAVTSTEACALLVSWQRQQRYACAWTVLEVLTAIARDLLFSFRRLSGPE